MCSFHQTFSDIHTAASSGGTPASLTPTLLASAIAAAAAAASGAAAAAAMPPPAARKRPLVRPTSTEFFAGAVQLPAHVVNRADIWNTSEVLGLSENLVFIGLSKTPAVEDALVQGTGVGASCLCIWVVDVPLIVWHVRDLTAILDVALPKGSPAMCKGATEDEYRLATRFLMDELLFLAPTEKWLSGMPPSTKAATIVNNLKKAIEATPLARRTCGVP